MRPLGLGTKRKLRRRTVRPAQHSHTFHVEPYASRRSARRCASPTPQVQRLAARESKIYVISLDIDTVRSRRRSGIPLKFLTDSARAHTYAVTTASVRWTSCVGHVWAAQPAPSSQKCAVGQLGRNALLLCTPADGSPSRAVHPHPPQEAHTPPWPLKVRGRTADGIALLASMHPSASEAAPAVMTWTARRRPPRSQSQNAGRSYFGSVFVDKPRHLDHLDP